MSKTNDFQWLIEDLEPQPSFAQMKMMGCELVSLHGRQQLVLADKAEPWHGLLVCTSREHHESLREDFPSLREHDVLGKWLYLSAKCRDFEETAGTLVDLVKGDDQRIGVKPKPKAKKRSPRASK